MNTNVEGIVGLLTANIWMVLMAVWAVGMLLGILFRGLMGRTRIRKAEVEAGIAQTELKQVQEELDALFAAQRKRQAEDATAIESDHSLTGNLEAEQVRVAELDRELSATRSELEALRMELADTVEAAQQAAEAPTPEPVADPVPEPVATESRPSAPLVDDAAIAAITERNEWLEDRVSILETELDTTPQAPASAQASVIEEELAKLRWRNRYLEGRLAYYEDGLAAASRVPEAEPAAAMDETIERSAPVLVAENDDVAQTGEDAEVESRIENEDDLAEEPDTETEDDATPSLVEAAEVEAVEVEAVEDQAEEAVDPLEDVEPDDAVGEPPHPSDAILAALDEGEDVAEAETVTDAEGTDVETDETETHAGETNGFDAIEPLQPPISDRPSGDIDDLTQIGGIGPRIAEVLHELGIWSFDQIANWSPEHAAWVEEQLAFQGRIARENWVEQAKSLI
ncbi:MAG: hypothetical protein AAFO63_05390 [Pseudomonadota bacterium]